MSSHHFCARSGSALAVFAVLSLVWLPPEHIHEIEEHGEHTELVHRHLLAHHAEHHDDEDSGAIFDHQDGEAHYLDSPFTIPASPESQTQSLLVATLAQLEPALTPAWHLLSIHVVRMHDPPWTSATGLRAPPSARHTLI